LKLIFDLVFLILILLRERKLMLTSIRKLLITAAIYTAATTLLLGIAYPLAVTGLSHLLFPDKADGQLIQQNGNVIGSRIIGQNFTAASGSPALGYFHGRPSAAGTGYDAANSGGSNLGPTSATLITRVQQSTTAVQAENPNTPVPTDLVTASASGLDPDITPAAAAFEAPRVARERSLSPAAVQQLIAAHTTPRQFGILGEPRVNVLELNLALDQTAPLKK
jgi:K+-transporting ATPase ATPase C chain